MFIEIRDAVKTYGKGENVIRAMDHVSMGVEKGEICVILGPSGSGKSTLLNMLGGLDSLDGGEIYVDGKRISGQSRKALTEYRRGEVGVVFQSYNLIAELNVRENIRVVRDISKNPLELEGVLEDLGLTRHAESFPAQLSGGQQQRCAIGRALIAGLGILQRGAGNAGKNE